MGTILPTSIALTCVRISSVNTSYLPRAWNSLDITNDDVHSVAAFKRLLKRSDLSGFMYFQQKCCVTVYFLYILLLSF